MAAWLRAEIEADRRTADVKIIREHWRIDPELWVEGTGIMGERAAPVAVCNGDYAANHIVRHDPLNALADCEAKLAILDLYAATRALVDRPPPAAARHPAAVKEHARMYGIPEAQAAATLVSARDYLDARRELAVLEPVVRLLASGYSHRAGYREEWKP